MHEMAAPQKPIKRSGRFKIFVALVLLACVFFFSSKAGALFLTKSIERAFTPIDASGGNTAQAIVVLTGGYLRTVEVARLHRATGLPVLASGGDGEAAAIKKQLEGDFHVPVRWTEGNSLNTEQNAVFSAGILATEHIQRIILVTHALHMPRAQRLFSDTGLEVIPAPTDFSSHAPLKWGDFLPSIQGRKLTASALHEVFGLAWYRMRQIIR